MKISTRVILITILAFSIHFIFDDLYFKDIRSWVDSYLDFFGISQNIAYTIVGIPIFLALYLLHGKNKMLSSIGFDTSAYKAFAFAVLFTLPMFLGFSLLFDISNELSWNGILIKVVAAGLFEEMYFRGFLFGQLFRYGNLKFIPAVSSGAIIFGLLHLYQGTEALELIGIFLITFLGAILFSWVYAEWNFNLWVPIFLHMLMNLAWEIFNVSDNALGGIWSNVFRALTIFLVIFLTIKSKKGKNLAIKRAELI